MYKSLSPNLPTKDLFLQACEEGNLELARVLLANGAAVNWVSGDTSWSGLHYAVRGGHGELLDLLMAQPGVEVNIKAKHGITPLMFACFSGKENFVRKLRQVEGIHINCQSDTVHGYTALHLAVVGGPSCVRELKGAAGLKWNLKDVAGRTPLLSAAFYGRADSLQVLLTVLHVDLASIDNSGYNVAWLAVKNSVWGNSLGCVKLLSEEPSVEWNTRDEIGDTPLLFCLKQKKLDLARILLSNPRVDLHVQNKAGKFPETIAR